MRFVPCVGREYCSDEGERCRGCGREHGEIARTRQLTGELAAFMAKMGYENPHEFLENITGKALKKLHAMESKPE